jgi:hypothetical protein
MSERNFGKVNKAWAATGTGPSPTLAAQTAGDLLPRRC